VVTKCPIIVPELASVSTARGIREGPSTSTAGDFGEDQAAKRATTGAATTKGSPKQDVKRSPWKRSYLSRADQAWEAAEFTPPLLSKKCKQDDQTGEYKLRDPPVTPSSGTASSPARQTHSAAKLAQESLSMLSRAAGRAMSRSAKSLPKQEPLE
jgi:hypothetical protein